MCLGILMSFKEPYNLQEEVLSLALRVRESIFDGAAYMQDSPLGEDFIDEENEKLRVKYTDETEQPQIEE